MQPGVEDVQEVRPRRRRRDRTRCSTDRAARKPAGSPWPRDRRRSRTRDHRRRDRRSLCNGVFPFSTAASTALRACVRSTRTAAARSRRSREPRPASRSRPTPRPRSHRRAVACRAASVVATEAVDFDGASLTPLKRQAPAPAAKTANTARRRCDAGFGKSLGILWGIRLVRSGSGHVIPPLRFGISGAGARSNDDQCCDAA